MTGSLFDPSPDFDRTALAAALQRLARENILVGGSSWKYEGWIGQIYSHSNYLSRGRFSRRLFEQECLREYAEVFQTVCGDFAFYQFPTQEFWDRLFTLVPANFRFAFKCPEQITSKIFPMHARYGAQGGQPNPTFLDAALFEEAFLRPLDRHRDRIAALVLEFGAFPRKAFSEVREFLEVLDPFLTALPRGFRYAVEIRNPEFLTPEYFACLRSRGVAHVFNAWSRMPELDAQLSIPQAVTADFVVSRALLRRGRSYENAVQMFSPYAEVKDPNPEVRESLRELIRRAREDRMEAYIYVNNRLEGNAPITIESVVSGV